MLFVEHVEPWLTQIRSIHADPVLLLLIYLHRLSQVCQWQVLAHAHTPTPLQVRCSWHGFGTGFNEMLARVSMSCPPRFLHMYVLSIIYAYGMLDTD